MVLDHVVQVISEAIQNQEVDTELLDPEVRAILGVFHFEQKTRPELINALACPSSIVEYLNLSEDARDALDLFDTFYPEYLRGEESGRQIHALTVPTKKEEQTKLRNIARLSRSVTLMVKTFDFYRADEKQAKYNLDYLLCDEQLCKQFGNAGWDIYCINRHIEDGFHKVVELATEIRPEIKDHWGYQEKSQHLFSTEQAVQDLITYFDFFLEHRPVLKLFNMHYLSTDTQFCGQFGTAGKNLYQNSYHKVKDRFPGLFQLAIKQRPEIADYTTLEGVLKVDGPKLLSKVFDFYLANRLPGKDFDVDYILCDELLRLQFNGSSQDIYFTSERKLKGGFQRILDLTTKVRPQIINYWKD